MEILIESENTKNPSIPSRLALKAGQKDRREAA